MTELSEDATPYIFEMNKGIPSGYQGVDIGPETIKTFTALLKKAGTLLWNGPVGVFEFKPLQKERTPSQKPSDKPKPPLLLEEEIPLQPYGRLELSTKSPIFQRGAELP